MNREQKKERRREARLRAKERKLQKAKELELEVDSETDVIETENDPEDEGVEKDMYPEEAYYPQPAPISFDELDEMRDVEEKAQAVREVTWDTETLVRNILHDPDMEPGEKADAISEVSAEFAGRVSVEIEDEKKEKDIELLQLEAIVAHEHRSMSALEFIEDMTKKVVSYASRSKMDDSKFAMVDTRDGKKVRKYLIHDKAHVRNALARAAQMIKRGGSAAADARKALPKIHAAAKKMGIGSSMEKEHNAILIEKDSKDQWRWVGWVSNNFVDWDGDIISEDAHKEYVDWLDKNMDVAPAFVCWHLPGTARKSAVDFAMYEDGFLIMSGSLTEDEAAGLLKAQAEVDLGMSHGTFVLSRDLKDPRVINKYRMYETSDLPLVKAANPFTDFETVSKEVGMDKKKYLAKILGSEEKADAFLEKTGLKQKALDAAGVESKEQTEVPAETAPVVPVPDSAPAPKEEVPPVAEAKALTVDEVLKAMDIEGLNAFVAQAKEDHEKIPVLEELVKQLQGNQDDKLAEKLTPPAARFTWSQEKRASQSEDTVIPKEEKDKVKPGVPEGYWLSDVTNTAPVVVES